jgi:hypothetical protein
MEISCHQMVRINDDYQGSEIKVCLSHHSTNTISPTDAKLSAGMENKTQLGRLGVLIRVRFHLVFVDYYDQYEMMSMVNRYLVN